MKLVLVLGILLVLLALLSFGGRIRALRGSSWLILLVAALVIGFAVTFL